MKDCIFCRILTGDIPSEMVYQDDSLVAIRDIHPVAPVHLLVVTRRHVADIMELAAHPEGSELMGAVLKALPEITRLAGIDQNGFRLINNCGTDGGQTIEHVHFHLIGGKQLGEKLL